MTTSITIITGRHAVKVENDPSVDILAEILEPGFTRTYHIHSGNPVLKVTEIPDK